MTLRTMRRLTAGLLAIAGLLSSPAKSHAGIEILIQEVDAGGARVGVAQYFTGASVSGVSTTHFSGVGVTITSSSGIASLNNTLTSAVTAQPGAGFDPTFGLRVWVTDNGFLTSSPGGFGLLKNSNSQSAFVIGGSNTVTNNSRVLSLPTTTPTPPTFGPATGTTIGGPTADATSTVNVAGDSGSSATTTANIASLPGAFAVQQTITIRATPLPGQRIDSQSTLGGTATAGVQANAPLPGVPAPGGLLLALIGLPLIGARRLRRAKA